jgi:hypothetical protein
MTSIATAPSKTWDWLRRNAVLAAALSLLLLIGIAIATVWVAQLNLPVGRVGTINALGTVLSVTGLLLSIGGFTLTLQQIAQTRSDVEATQAEASRIRLSLETYESAHEASQAAYALKSAKGHLELGSYPQLASSYSDCSQSLTLIRENVADLPSDLIAGIEDAESYIEGLCLKIDKGTLKLGEKHIAEMRRHSLLIRKIQIYLQRKSI